MFYIFVLKILFKHTVTIACLFSSLITLDQRELDLHDLRVLERILLRARLVVDTDIDQLVIRGCTDELRAFVLSRLTDSVEDVRARVGMLDDVIVPVLQRRLAERKFYKVRFKSRERREFRSFDGGDGHVDRTLSKTPTLDIDGIGHRPGLHGNGEPLTKSRLIA